MCISFYFKKWNFYASSQNLTHIIFLKHFWHTSEWAHCVECIMELLNGLFYPGNWSHRCQDVNWDSIHSQPTDRFWIIAANCVGWSGRHQERSRESVCVDLWLYMNDSSGETRLKPLFQRKKKRKKGQLEHSQWNLSAHLRKVSPKSLGNLCAPLQLHSQTVLG